MSRVTKQDLIDQIESLKKQNERLVADREQYFIRMQNAELEAERVKRQPPEAEQLEFDRDELLREVDSLRAELEATKGKLKEARKTANRCEHELNDLKRKYQTARSTIEMQRQSIANKEKDIAALKKSAAESFNNSAAINEQQAPENPKRGRPVAITEQQRQSIRLLRERGVSVRAIAQAVGVSVGSVQRILNADKSAK